MDNNVLYQSLYDAYKSAFSDLKGNHIYAYFDLSLLSVVILGDKVQKMAVDFWKESKSQNANQEKLKETILTKISDLKKRRNKCSISRFLISGPIARLEKLPQSKDANVILEEIKTQNTNSPSEGNQVIQNNLVQVQAKTQRSAPKQTALKDAISLHSSELERLQKIRDRGLGNDETDKHIEDNKRKLHKFTKDLKTAENNARNNRKHREVKRKKMEQLEHMVPDVSLVKSGPGRHPIEHKQPELLQVIVDIVMSQSSAEGKRRYSVLRTCQTLDDLHSELKQLGFCLSRTALYHRLLPKRQDSTEGKRHVKTVPVKLIKATSTYHKKHVDSHFAMASIKYLKDLAKIMGPGPVFFLSQDDKSRVPIGLPAATKQAPFLMTMERRVRLPDHDFVVAGSHKLIPSVYAAAKIDPDNGVTYSGPTFIAIRSAKHDSSNPSTHSFDFDSLYSLDEFKTVCKTSDGKPKPIVIISVDGGPDENPRFESSFICLFL